MSEHERKVIKRDLEVAIVHLIGIFQDYANKRGHKALLACGLLELLENLVISHREIEIAGDEAEDEDEDEDEGGMPFNSIDNDLLH
jgi:hypothetical protein